MKGIWLPPEEKSSRTVKQKTAVEQCAVRMVGPFCTSGFLYCSTVLPLHCSILTASGLEPAEHQ
jgi:hypothetical protein